MGFFLMSPGDISMGFHYIMTFLIPVSHQFYVSQTRLEVLKCIFSFADPTPLQVFAAAPADIIL